jgi:hypothetical protein
MLVQFGAPRGEVVAFLAEQTVTVDQLRRTILELGLMVDTDGHVGAVHDVASR